MELMHIKLHIRTGWQQRSPNIEQTLEDSGLRPQQNVRRTRTRTNRSTFNRSTNIEHNVHLSRPNRTSNTTTSANTTSNRTANVEQVPKIRTQPKQHLYREQNIEHNISVMRTEHPTQHWFRTEHRTEQPGLEQNIEHNRVSKSNTTMCEHNTMWTQQWTQQPNSNTTFC